MKKELLKKMRKIRDKMTIPEMSKELNMPARMVEKILQENKIYKKYGQETIMKEKLKYPKLQIIGFIADWVEEHNNPPNLKQIANGLGLKAISTISQHLHEMGIDYSKEKYKLMYRCPYCKRDLTEEIKRNTQQDAQFQKEKREREPSEVITIPIKGIIKNKRIIDL